MPHHHRRRHGHAAAAEEAEEEAPSPRPSSAGCYTFLRSASRRGGGGYRRLDSSASASASAAEDVIRVEVGTTKGERSVFHVDPAVLEAGPVRRLLAAAGRRTRGGAVAVAVDAMLFEHLLWLQAAGSKGMLGYDDDDKSAAADLSEIVEFYSQDDDVDDSGHRGF